MQHQLTKNWSIVKVGDRVWALCYMGLRWNVIEPDAPGRPCIDEEMRNLAEEITAERTQTSVARQRRKRGRNSFVNGTGWKQS